MRSLIYSLLAATALWVGCAASASAAVTVVTSTQDLAWLTTAIGGKNVSADYMASSSQDPHKVEPRPSQVRRMTQADMLVRVGLDLDLWMDSLIRASGNGRISPGGKGYVDASKGVRLLEVPSGKLDPSQGDIHIYGNPHYFYGPSSLPIVARNILDGLKRVDAAHAGEYQANYDAFIKTLQGKWREWQAKMKPFRGKQVVTYHKSLIYLLTDLGLREFDNVEPKPGIEPTASHVSRVGKAMKADGVKVVLTEHWRPRQFADLMASQGGGTVVVIPGGIGAQPGIDDYFKWVDACVEALAKSL